MRQLVPVGKITNSKIQTPLRVAKAIVEYFHPTGKILEPCCGEGNFLKFLPGADWCEIDRGRDFFNYPLNMQYDWVITNPPFDQFRKFLKKSCVMADNVVFLTTINHFWLKARLRDMEDTLHTFKTILLMPTPSTFPPSGFQVGCVHVQAGYRGPVKIEDLYVKE